MLPQPRPKFEDPNKASSSGTKKHYDFRFQLQPPAVTLVRNAMAALADPQFNPNMSGVMSVGDAGFDIAVDHITTFEDEEEHYVGYLCLYADKLDQFVCKKQMRKRVSVKDISKFLNLAEDNDTVTIYVEFETGLLSFDFSPATSNSLGPFTTSTKFLWDVSSKSKIFPDVSYGVEVAIPSSVFSQMGSIMLDFEADDRSDYISMGIMTTTVRTEIGDYELETRSDNIGAWLTWPYWDSMRSATRLSEECTMYLVTNPYHHMMLKFNVGELGYFVYFKKEPHCFDSRISTLGHFNALN